MCTVNTLLHEITIYLPLLLNLSSVTLAIYYHIKNR